MNASVTIRFEGDEVDVRIIDHGEEPAGEEAQWLAFLALPHLTRKAFTTEESRETYRLSLAQPLIEKRLK